MILKREGSWLAAGCTHGDLIDEDAFDKMLQFKNELKPKHVIHLGDAFEFTALRKNASTKELGICIDQDIDFGLWAMDEMFEGAETKIYLRGNHCERLWKMAESGNQVSVDFARSKIDRIEAHLATNKVTMLPYCSHKGICMINNTIFMHGILYGINAGRDHLRAYHHNLVFVHTHRAEDATIPSWPNPLTAINAGCLRQLLPEYAERTVSTLGWKHAFAYGEFLKNNTSTMNLEKL